MTLQLSKSKKNNHPISYWLILFHFSSSVYAANHPINLNNLIFVKEASWLNVQIIGASMAEIGNTNSQINYYNGFLNDAYPVHPYAYTAVIGLSGGYEFVSQFLPAMALGLGIYAMPKDYDYNGQLVETALDDPSSTLYNYKFHLNSIRVMFETQVTWLFNQFTPYINIGIGTAVNRLSGYTENPVDNTGYVALPPFQSQTNTNFAYQIGLGVGYAFNFMNGASTYLRERIALGYRYVSLGDNSFGTRGDVYPYYLEMGGLTSHEIVLTYMHLWRTL